MPEQNHSLSTTNSNRIFVSILASHHHRSKGPHPSCPPSPHGGACSRPASMQGWRRRRRLLADCALLAGLALVILGARDLVLDPTVRADEMAGAPGFAKHARKPNSLPGRMGEAQEGCRATRAGMEIVADSRGKQLRMSAKDKGLCDGSRLTDVSLTFLLLFVSLLVQGMCAPALPSLPQPVAAPRTHRATRAHRATSGASVAAFMSVAYHVVSHLNTRPCGRA